jgi:hypothetical protein
MPGFFLEVAMQFLLEGRVDAIATVPPLQRFQLRDRSFDVSHVFLAANACA